MYEQMLTILAILISPVYGLVIPSLWMGCLASVVTTLVLMFGGRALDKVRG